MRIKNEQTQYIVGKVTNALVIDYNFPKTLSEAIINKKKPSQDKQVIRTRYDLAILSEKTKPGGGDSETIMNLERTKQQLLSKMKDDPLTLYELIIELLCGGNASAEAGINTLINNPEEFEKAITDKVDTLIIKPLQGYAMMARGILSFDIIIKQILESLMNGLAELVSEFAANQINALLKKLGISPDTFANIFKMLLNTDKDTLSASFCTMTTDPGLVKDKNKPEYDNSMSLYTSAVQSWRNAPRMHNASVVSAYFYAPDITQLKRFVILFKKLLDDGLFSGNFWGNIGNIFKDLFDRIVGILRDLFKSFPITISSAVLNDDSNLNFGLKFGSDSSMVANDPSVTVDFINNNGLLSSLGNVFSADPSKNYFVELSVEDRIGTDVSNTYFKTKKEDRRKYILKGLCPNAFIEHDKVSLTKNTGSEAGTETLLKALYDGNGANVNLKLFANLWCEYTDKVTNQVKYLRVDQEEVVNIKDPEREKWYKISLDGLLFDFDFLKNIKDWLSKELKKILALIPSLAGIIDSLLNTILAVIRGILNQVLELLRALSAVLGLIKCLDVYYVVFKGSYFDLPTAWGMVKDKVRLQEDLPNFIMNLVLSGPNAEQILKNLDKASQEAKKNPPKNSSTQSEAVAQTATTPFFSDITIKPSEIIEIKVNSPDSESTTGTDARNNKTNILFINPPVVRDIQEKPIFSSSLGNVNEVTYKIPIGKYSGTL